MGWRIPFDLVCAGLKVEFKEDGVKRIAHIAARANAEHDNTGARRLHTVLEKVLEPISFDAVALAQLGQVRVCERDWRAEIDSAHLQTIVIDTEFVDRHTG
jgi:ATP-dependent protease HslVU (ClpYQ) ATPase subunit